MATPNAGSCTEPAPRGPTYMCGNHAAAAVLQRREAHGGAQRQGAPAFRGADDADYTTTAAAVVSCKMHTSQRCSKAR